MNKNLISAILSVFLLFSIAGTVLAQTQVGVSVGDTFTYSVSSNSNVPQIYQVIVSPKDIDWLNVKIVNIDNEIIRLNITQHYKNRTETRFLEDKVLTAATNFPMTQANLNVNDKLWPDEPLSPIVNETVTQSFPSGYRQVNLGSIGPQESGYDLVDYSFDKLTGMPLKVRYVESDQVSTVLTLTSSNLNIIPEFPTVTILILLMLLVTLAFTAATIVRRKTCSS
jgi:hypothetical protein